MSNLIPQLMTYDELSGILADMAVRVREGDSFEGNVEYWIPEEGDHYGDRVAVRGVYRIGNTMGQGGTRMIGRVPS